MGPRTWGTVVVGIEIDKNGKVLHPVLISGPKPLQKAVLGAVRKYKYNPYLLNGEPTVVATTVSVTTYNH
jgi:protein TonB